MAHSSSYTPSIYKLSSALHGHTDEVRSVAVFQDGSIVSTSRDNTTRLWLSKDGKYKESMVMKGHTDFVNTCCVIEPSERNPTGFIITGGKDKNICIYYPGQEEPFRIINAHDDTICSLKTSVFEKESFLSCSGDHLGKLWNSYDLTKPQAIFTGHSLTTAVWCIKDLPNGMVVTGGSDKNVIVYLRDGQVLHLLKGHLDAVRDIVEVSESEFLSCSNDSDTKHWSAISGNCIGTYKGHNSHVYSISASLGGGLAVSCGEDWSIKIWRNGKVDQSITMPVQTIWCVKFLPNEDIVCGSSDGIIRIFTVNPDRFINNEILMEFEKEALINFEKYLKVSDGKNVEEASYDALTSSELQQPGENDGDTVIIKDAKGHTAGRMYKWSQRHYQWFLMADVIEGKKTSGKPIYNGVEYDYVFSVDIDEEKPHLKLPYNKGENPYIVAQKFLEDNNIHQDYLLRVANFIESNLQLNPILKAEAQYVDPFAGGSRYISTPSTSSGLLSAAASLVKPFITEHYIPQTCYLKLDQANIPAIFKKLKEFNDKTVDGVQCFTIEKLDNLLKLVNKEPSESIKEEIVTLKALLTWPDNILFPVLDIARLAVLQKDVNENFCDIETLNMFKHHMQKDAIIPNQMLTLRLLANLFNHEAGERFCLEYKNDMLAAIGDLTAFGNKNNEIAVSSYCLNLIVALNKANDATGKKETLNVILKLLEILTDSEAIFRIVVAIGTLIMGAANEAERKDLIGIMRRSKTILKSLRVLLDEVETSSVPNKLLGIAKQVIDLMKDPSQPSTSSS